MDETIEFMPWVKWHARNLTQEMRNALSNPGVYLLARFPTPPVASAPVTWTAKEVCYIGETAGLTTDRDLRVRLHEFENVVYNPAGNSRHRGALNYRAEFDVCEIDDNLYVAIYPVDRNKFESNYACKACLQTIESRLLADYKRDNDGNRPSCNKKG